MGRIINDRLCPAHVRTLPSSAVNLEELTALLMRNGFVAADEEAEELLAAGDGGRLEALVERRLTGEPLAWITGTAPFCGLTVRRRTPASTSRAGRPSCWPSAPPSGCPPDGVAIDLCTGCGAIAALLPTRRPGARVLGVDLDPSARSPARAPTASRPTRGDLFAPLPDARGALDVVVGVVPYVPTRRARAAAARHVHLRDAARLRRRRRTGATSCGACWPRRRTSCARRGAAARGRWGAGGELDADLARLGYADVA